MTNKMPNDRTKSRMVPIFKGKGDVLECNNYRGIKLMILTMKPWERMIEITKITDNQFGFRPGKSTTEPIFALILALSLTDGAGYLILFAL